MAAVGALDFSFSDGLDSGVALLLVNPPQEAVRGMYRDCQLIASPGSPHVICRFSGATREEGAFAAGLERAQEALDILSVLGRGDLVTKDAEDEHLVWWQDAGRQSLSVVSTATFSVQVGSMEIAVRDAQGNTVPPIPVIPRHHIGFRFYRLAQASDDLYDAYRNMYLAFESLLSARYPKSRGQEIDWLRQSLSSASADLALKALVPASIPDPVRYFLDTVYQGARLPLFHAKDGRAYFAPSRSALDRAVVQEALSMLTQVVLRMADSWYSARRRSSWVNLELLSKQDRQLFDGGHFVFVDDPTVDLKREIDDSVLAAGIPFQAVFKERHAGTVRHNLSGQISTSHLGSRHRLQAVYFAKDGKALIGFSSDATVDCSGFDDLNVRLFVRGRNAGQPRHMYSR